jgi:hypothetical protein
MTDDPLEQDGERRIRGIRENRLLAAQQKEQYLEMLEDVSDTELITTTSAPDPLHEMEMQRRLKSAVFDLKEEVVASRESSETMTSKLNASIADLTSEITTFRTSADEAAKKSDKAAGKLVLLTWVIIGLTVIVAGLTVVLVILTVRGDQPSPPPARPQPTHSVTRPHRSGKAPTASTPPQRATDSRTRRT